MKRYKLLKDLPTFKAGEIFILEDDGSLYYYKSDNHEDAHWSDKIMAYHYKTLEKFPNILEDWFEEIKPCEPAKGYIYFFIDDEGIVLSDAWWDLPCDFFRKEIGNCFRTKEEAEKAREWLKAFNVLAQDTKGYKFNEKTSKNYSVCYHYDVSRLEWCWGGHYNQCPLCFATEEDAEESIKKHEKEWRIFLGVGDNL